MDSKKGELSISIKESDIGTLYIVQHELHQNPAVSFAGVIVKHPLTNECWIRVSSKGSPVKEMIKAAEAAIAKSSEIAKILDSKLG